MRLAQWETPGTEAAAGVEPALIALQAIPFAARACDQFYFFRQCFRQESNLRLQLRRLVSYPLDHGSVGAPGWIRTTVSEEPGLQPGAIDRSATGAGWGGWRDLVRDDGLEPPAVPV